MSADYTAQREINVHTLYATAFCETIATALIEHVGRCFLIQSRDSGPSIALVLQLSIKNHTRDRLGAFKSFCSRCILQIILLDLV